MLQASNDNRIFGRRYALCVGISIYTDPNIRNVRYAVNDTTIIAERLSDPQRGNFAVTVLTESVQTTKEALDEVVAHMLSSPDRQTEDLALLYFSCHGDINPTDHTFCLLPSNASLRADKQYDPTTLIGIADFARWFANATIQNIVVLLDVCHSGGAGAALQRFTLKLDAGPNFFFIGAARSDQRAMQSSRLQHGLFTHCLLRAFEQPPTSDGWLTVSQIHTFISDELPWFAKEQPTHIQSWSVSVNPNLPLVRNPGYPELAPLPPVWNVPFQRNIFFTEQDDLLSQLASILHHEQKMALTHPSAISGLGGIGKTQVALEYAYRHRQDYHAVLWGRADTRESLISTFVTIALLLDLPEREEKDRMVIVNAVKEWLQDRTAWLFILDNVDELALVKEFLPAAFRGHLLLTTRAQAMGGLARKLEIEVMRPEIGMLFLLRRSGRLSLKDSLEKVSSVELLEAENLTQELGGLPLALDQAGAYMEETLCGVANYRQLYHRQRARLLARRGGVVPEHPEPVATTWSLSFEKVEQANSTAVTLLRLCAFLSPDAIPEELLVLAVAYSHASPYSEQTKKTGGMFSWLTSLRRKKPEGEPLIVTSEEIDEAVAVLRAYSLIQRNTQEATFSMHRLVQAILQDGMEGQESITWIGCTIRAVNAIFPRVEFRTWEQCARYLPQALSCATWIMQKNLQLREGANLLHRAGWYLDERAQYGEAEHLYKRSLLISEQQLGEWHSDTAASLNNLAELYRVQGRYEESELLCQRSLVISEQRLGSEHPDTAISLNNLALLYHTQGKYAQAEPLFTRALSINERVLGNKHPETARSLDNLGGLYREQGKYSQAEPLLRRALSIREQQLGEQHPDTATSLNNLAGLYFVQKKYSQSEPLYQRAISIREQQLEDNHPDLAVSLNNLAFLYHMQKRYTEAEQLFQRAILIYEQQLGDQHPGTAQSLNNLAALYREQKKYALAEPLFERAILIYEQQLGDQHPETAQSLDNLAALYREQKKYALAEPLFERVLSIREQQLGDQHPETAQSLNNLAVLYREQKKYALAEPLFERAVSICEQQLGSEHINTAASLNNLGGLYREQKKYALAEPLLKRAVSICEQQLGDEHPNTAMSLNNLAFLYKTQKKYGAAEPLYRRALAIFERILGRENPTTQTARVNYAILLREMGHYAEAKKLEESS